MKAILVLDEMPKNCLKCPIGKNISIPLETCIQCPLGKCAIDEETKTRPDWCPLKELPKKKKDTSMTNYKRYVQGWNDCIDRILEGSEEDERLQQK